MQKGFAQASDPAVIISIASVDEQLDDVEHMVSAAGFAQFAPMVQMGVSEYLNGIDRSKPIGVMMYFEDDDPMPIVLAAIPVTDFEDVLDTISEFVDIDESGAFGRMGVDRAIAVGKLA